MRRFEEVRALRELGATSVEFDAQGELSKVTFAVQTQAMVLPKASPTAKADDKPALTTEQLKDAIRRRELTGR